MDEDSATAKDAKARAIQNDLFGGGAAITLPPAIATRHLPLDPIGGEEELPTLKRELVRALLGDRVLSRSRLGNVGRARLEEFMEQRLRTLLGVAIEWLPIAQTEILWEVRPTHAEFEAAAAAIDEVLTKRGVDDATRSTLEDALFGDESMQSAELTRMTALVRRAAASLSCGEAQISTKPLESDDHRIVSGCGKTAIYDYATENAPPMWRREPAL